MKTSSIKTNKFESENMRKSRSFDLTFADRDFVDYTVTDHFLSNEECDAFVEWSNGLSDMEFGSIYSEDGSAQDPDKQSYRVVLTAAISDTEFGWLYDRIANEVHLINDKFYDYDIRGLHEELVFLKYHDFEERGLGRFDWHRDTDGVSIQTRKITTIIQLSDDADYDDCDLYLWQNGETRCTARTKGQLISFPSWKSHKITPITRGTRCSIVCWVTGPPFK